jgi:hypothetical protein
MLRIWKSYWRPASFSAICPVKRGEKPSTGSRGARMTLDTNELEEADDIPIISPPDAL